MVANVTLTLLAWMMLILTDYSILSVSHMMLTVTLNLMYFAVRLVPYRCNVFDTSEQLALQNNNRPLTFDEYASLLEAAAQNHDEVTKGSKPKANPRKAYATDVVTTGDLEPDPGPPMFDFNIDMDLGNYYAYRTSLSSACKTFLPNELWQQLDDQG
ncbi:unnamed protein product [Cylindrotheca closterium]|uniref:Uncharacterized protein n=1 Tax=Cylindrotheca closterium TaxID=2856 RepID=A0AAD2PXH8_9STRA|nr:unnamed protein product [Cylindrotheca closterium]